MSSPRLHKSLPTPMPCPCCSKPISRPTLDVVADALSFEPLQKRALAGLWSGKGDPVPNERVIDFIYVDNDLRPLPKLQYETFKITMHHVRRKLSGSGLTVGHAGYSLGFFLQVDEVENSQADTMPRLRITG